LIFSYPKLKLLVLGTLLVFSLVQITSLKIDYKLDQYFPENDSLINRYFEYAGDFGSDEELLLIAIENEVSIFEMDFLNQIKNISDTIDKIEGVEKVSSLVNLFELVKTPMGLLPKKALRFSDKEELLMDSQILVQDEKWKGWLFSDNKKALIVFVVVEKGLENQEKTFAVESIKRLLKQSGISDFHFSGTLYTSVYFLKMTFYETVKSIISAAIVIVIFIFLIFRSLNKTMVIMATLFTGLILFYGLLGTINQPLNLISALFPTLIVIVGVSDLIHFMTRVENQDIYHKNTRQALLNTLKEISTTLFITSLTTIIGLLAFLITGIKSIQEFAILGVIGVLVTFLLAIFVFPLLLLKFNKSSASYPVRSSHWPSLMERIYNYGKEKPGILVTVFIFLMMVSIIGISRLSLNSKLMDPVMNHSSLKKDFTYFEENLGGGRALEIIIQINDPFRIASVETLREMEKLQDYLASFKITGPLVSPVNSFKYINSVYYPQLRNNYLLPSTQKDADVYFSHLLALPQFINGKLFLTEKNTARLFGRMQDIGAVEMRNFIKETLEWAGENLDAEILSMEFTGSALLFDTNNLNLVNSMIYSLLIALTLVSLIMVFLFRSMRFILVSLLPNLLPLMIVGGILGFFQIEITGSMALIFTLGFVIAVDDTIHFLSKYKYELDQNNKPEAALKNTIMTTGKAIIVTSLVLSAGYTSIIISESRESFFHGLLIGMTLIVALFTDLFLLPILIRSLTIQKT